MAFWSDRARSKYLIKGAVLFEKLDPSSRDTKQQHVFILHQRSIVSVQDNTILVQFPVYAWCGHAAWILPISCAAIHRGQPASLLVRRVQELLLASDLVRSIIPCMVSHRDRALILSVRRRYVQVVSVQFSRKPEPLYWWMYHYVVHWCTSKSL